MVYLDAIDDRNYHVTLTQMYLNRVVITDKDRVKITNVHDGYLYGVSEITGTKVLIDPVLVKEVSYG